MSQKDTCGALYLYTDGASKGNPGLAGIGVVLTDADGHSVEESAEFIGQTTNNIAEYRALLHGLQLASRRKPSVLHVRSDSELMVRQILGIYKVRNPGLKPLHAEALTQLRAFPQWNIRHVPRDDNSLADGLANRAIQTHKYSLPGK